MNKQRERQRQRDRDTQRQREKAVNIIISLPLCHLTRAISVMPLHRDKQSYRNVYLLSLFLLLHHKQSRQRVLTGEGKGGVVGREGMTGEGDLSTRLYSSPTPHPPPPPPPHHHHLYNWLCIRHASYTPTVIATGRLITITTCIYDHCSSPAYVIVETIS